ncbi:hypothetical protein CEXT_206371 [Caerostris extrusa]|uniref:Uncharacterized protein n=1 Tax=Caerostris extrusa TaxID=172846 RepID=A0AAV4RMR5_CAEEX|nr:hypothetical protein CEXT_206371 [Caerostris extrusa]
MKSRGGCLSILDNLMIKGIQPLPDKIKCIIDFLNRTIVSLTQLIGFEDALIFINFLFRKPIFSKSSEELTWIGMIKAFNIAKTTLSWHPIPEAQLNMGRCIRDHIGGTLMQYIQENGNRYRFSQ